MVYVENRLKTPVGSVEPDTEGWLATLSGHYPEKSLAVLRRACEMAQQAHGGQLRASGEPYLLHLLAVADILVDLRLDYETIAAALMAEDVRVVLIKLADRLHNMRTLKHLPLEKQRRIARETQEIYAPLANRLGIWQLKWELEDLAFRHLEPEKYRRLACSLDERRVEREQYIEGVIRQLSRALTDAGIEAQVTGRPKHIYSIWRKMQRKGVGLEQLYDLRAVRILVNEVADCYHALGIVHTEPLSIHPYGGDRPAGQDAGGADPYP